MILQKLGEVWRAMLNYRISRSMWLAKADFNIVQYKNLQHTQCLSVGRIGGMGSHWWKMARLKRNSMLATGEKMPKSPQTEHNVATVFVRILVQLSIMGINEHYSTITCGHDPLRIRL